MHGGQSLASDVEKDLGGPLPNKLGGGGGV